MDRVQTRQRLRSQFGGYRIVWTFAVLGSGCSGLLGIGDLSSGSGTSAGGAAGYAASGGQSSTASQGGVTTLDGGGSIDATGGDTMTDQGGTASTSTGSTSNVNGGQGAAPGGTMLVGGAAGYIASGGQSSTASQGGVTTFESGGSANATGGDTMTDQGASTSTGGTSQFTGGQSTTAQGGTVGGSTQTGGVGVTTGGQDAGIGGTFSIVSGCPTGAYSASYVGQSASSPGNGSVALEPTNGTICYLNWVSGQFHSSSEWVAVIDDNNGNWVLSTNALSTGVAGHASCYSMAVGTEVTEEVRWKQTERSSGERIDLGHPDEMYHCFLVRVSGHFQGKDELLEVYDDVQSDGMMHHYLRGWYGASGLGINGAARCYGPLSNYMPYETVLQGDDDLPLGDAGYGVTCQIGLLNQNPYGLRWIGGKFEGYDEAIGVWLYNDNPWAGAACSGGQDCRWEYYLHVSSHQQNVGGGVVNIPF